MEGSALRARLALTLLGSLSILFGTNGALAARTSFDDVDAAQLQRTCRWQGRDYHRCQTVRGTVLCIAETEIDRGKAVRRIFVGRDRPVGTRRRIAD